MSGFILFFNSYTNTALHVHLNLKHIFSILKEIMGVIFRTFPKGLWKFKSKNFSNLPDNYFNVHTHFQGRAFTTLVSTSFSTFSAELSSKGKKVFVRHNIIGTVGHLNLACMKNSSCWFYLGFLFLLLFYYM